MEILAYIIYGVLVSIFGWFMATVIIDVPQMSRDIDRLNDTVEKIEKIMKDMKKITAEKEKKGEQNADNT